MQTIVIQERVVTDDELILPDEGMILKGGYAAAVRYHTYANPWEDHEHMRRFRTVEAALRWIRKRYGDDADWDLIECLT